MLVNVQLENWFIFEIQFCVAEVQQIKAPTVLWSSKIESLRDMNKKTIISEESLDFGEVQWWQAKDYEILEILKQDKIQWIENNQDIKENIKVTTIQSRKDKQLRNVSDEVVGHEIYDISRELPNSQTKLLENPLYIGIEFADISAFKSRLFSFQEKLTIEKINTYMVRKKIDMSIEEYLNQKIFNF